MDKALAIQKQVIEILGTDEVYLVGGSVRDLVMNNTPKDYDFTTSMLPEIMVDKVKAAGRRVYTIGEKFGTIGFKVPVVELKEVSDMGSAGFEFEGKEVRNIEIGTTTKYEYVEVTTFRSEVYTNKSRHPEVQFVPSLDEDLARRDFTMNAMVLRPDGTIYDPYGGRLHIHGKKIQTVGMPKERIQEDPLRMLRAARFAARYGFTIDPNFIGKARQIADRIYDVSVERWVQELDKILVSDYPTGLKALREMGLYYRIFPEFNGAIQEWGGKPYDDVDLAWKHLFMLMDSNPKTAKFIATGLCHRFKFSNERRDFILDKPKKKE